MRIRLPKAWLAYISLLAFLATPASSMAVTTVGQPDGDLSTLSLLKTLHDYYPNEYRQIVRTASDEGTKYYAWEIASFQDQFRALMQSQIPRISDENAKRLLQLMVKEGAALRETSPSSCVALLSGGTPSVNLVNALPPDLINEEMGLDAALLAQTATDPAPEAGPASMREFKSVAISALVTMPPSEAAEFLPGHKKPEGNAATLSSCDFYLSVYRAILELPNGRSGSMLRSLKANGFPGDPIASASVPATTGNGSSTAHGLSAFPMPAIVETHDKDSLSQFYPEIALRMDCGGAAKVQCAISDSGEFEKCEVLSESPAGWGFGDAAIKAALARFGSQSTELRSKGLHTFTTNISFNNSGVPTATCPTTPPWVKVAAGQ